MRYVMEEVGLQASYWVRMSGPLVGVPILLWVRLKHFQLGTWSLRIVFAAHVAVLVWHFYITEFFTLHLR
jgi:hypothetical protein